MTPAKSTPTNVVVVDGSNIATEGRSTPSLAQLVDAVTAFTEEFPDAVVTVVVDATFGHRIDKKELAEFDAAVAHNELVAPPAGAIGRGDAFVLSIANKVGAKILSNDSFQEFHGDYPWLFDEGRLIGGKPVPFVGWVFVERLPVKGPVSRKATRSARGGGREREAKPSRRQPSKEASLPMPVPTAPPPARRPEKAAPAEPAASAARNQVQAPPSGPVNDLLPFLDFVEHHPVGSSVNGVVESYSSHGSYVAIGDVRGYVPLRLMGDPPPRSAREVMKLGDAVTLVVTSFAPARRSIDLAIPKVAPVGEVATSPPLQELAAAVAPARTSRRRVAKRGGEPVPEPVASAVEEAVAEAALEVAETPPPAPTKKAAAKKAAAKKTPARPAPAKKAAAKKAAAKKAATTRARAEVATAGDGEQPAAEATAPEPPSPIEEAPAKPARKRSAKRAAAPADGVAADGVAAPAKRPARKRAVATATTDGS
jgi:S1 RNA binding domain/Zc3h12a-like Ribonuclease NYN domain